MKEEASETADSEKSEYCDDPEETEEVWVLKVSTVTDTGTGPLTKSTGTGPVADQGAMGFMVNRGHSRINWRSSGMVILLEGSHSKMRFRIQIISSDSGRMDFRK